MVKDDTGESSFMLLDSIAKGIVPQSAEYLLNGSLDEVRRLLCYICLCCGTCLFFSENMTKLNV